MKNTNCIMLIDDNPADNLFHKITIETNKVANHVLDFTSAIKALEYLKNNNADNYIFPNIIFLDINMPKMNGWEFLEEYKDLEAVQKSDHMVVMLTTSRNPDDKHKAESFGIVADFYSKPITGDDLKAILQKLD
jgi:CheY-like chemotaxis protein